MVRLSTRNELYVWPASLHRPDGRRLGIRSILEDTIFRHRALLNMVSLEDSRHLVYTEDLARLEIFFFDSMTLVSQLAVTECF